MKKIFAIFLLLNFLLLPVSAETYDYSIYDFSDEAQMRFDNQQLYNINSNKVYDKDKYKTNQNQFEEVTLDKPTNQPTIIDINTLQELQKQKNQDLNDYDLENPILELIDDYNYDGIGNPYVKETINKQQVQKPLTATVVRVPEGTTFQIQFESGISSGSLEQNDSLVATLPVNFVYNGKVVAPAGSMVYGNVINAKSAGYAYGTGDMEISFNKILPPEGNPIQISTENIVVKGKSSRAKNMTRDVLVGAGIGIIGGVLTYLLTGSSSSESFVRAISVGGGVGAASGGLRGAIQRGEEVQIPAGTRIQLKLTSPVNVSIYGY